MPLELISHYFETVTGEIVKLISFDTSVKEIELLNAITKPLTKKIVQLDKTTLDLIAKNQTKGGETLLKHICTKTIIVELDENGLNTTITNLKKCKLMQ